MIICSSAVSVGKSSEMSRKQGPWAIVISQFTEKCLSLSHISTHGPGGGGGEGMLEIAMGEPFLLITPF